MKFSTKLAPSDVNGSQNLSKSNASLCCWFLAEFPS